MTNMNVVLIMADQWRGDCFGCVGHPVVETPNIDRVFHDGVIFDQAYSAVPSCIAARAALLTGLTQRNHGRVGYQDRVMWNYKETLPGLLAAAGYHTHCVGKMHVFPARNLMGFHSVDLHDGYLHTERCNAADYGLVDDYLPWLREKCGSDVDITDAGVGCNGYSVSPWPYEERYHPTNWVTSKSIDFLRRRDPTKPFFLKISYHRPHPPLDPPRYYLDRYMNKELPLIPVGDWAADKSYISRGLDSPVPLSKDQIDLARRAYYAQLTHIDCQINRLTHALCEHSLEKNTLIIFVSDHGEMLYDHNMVAKAVGFNGSARIPFMIKFPAAVDAPLCSHVGVPVELRDVLPTILDAVGVDIPDSVDGRSVLPLCRQESGEWREYIHGEHSGGKESNHWITNGHEMYIWYSQTGRELYFDLDSDPYNSHDLSLRKGDRVAYLRGKLIEELAGREEGYVKNGELVVGCATVSILSEAGQG
jgi:arylsulfatase A-like enzyme